MNKTDNGDWTIGGALTIGDYTEVTLDGNDLTVSGAVVLGTGSSIVGANSVITCTSFTGSVTRSVVK
jgi:hypothetical protein